MIRLKIDYLNDRPGGDSHIIFLMLVAAPITSENDFTTPSTSSRSRKSVYSFRTCLKNVFIIERYHWLQHYLSISDPRKRRWRISVMPNFAVSNVSAQGWCITCPAFNIFITMHVLHNHDFYLPGFARSQPAYSLFDTKTRGLGVIGEIWRITFCLPWRYYTNIVNCLVVQLCQAFHLVLVC